MPIYVKHPQRPDGAPFVYFKGKPSELKRIEPSTIEELLASNLPAGPKNTDLIELRQIAVSEFKKNVLESFGKKWPSYNGKRTYMFINIPKGNILSKSFGNKYPSYEGKKAHLLIDFPEGNIQFVLRKLNRGRVAIYQHPLLHTIIYPKMDSFIDLKNILKKGFKAWSGPNVDAGWRRAIQWRSGGKSLVKETEGDRYQLEFMAPANNLAVEYCPPNQILRINIYLDRRHDKTELESKRAFYKKHLQDVPFGLINKPVER